jgi:hypothetical protein
MMKMLVTFFSLFVIFYAGIEIFRKMSGQEKWEVVKTFSYSLALSLVVIVCLTLLVVVF